MPWLPNHLVDALQAVTGWDISLWEMMKVGERAATLTRLFNLRRGFDAGGDLLKERFHQTFTSGPLKSVAYSEKEFLSAVRLYYG